MRRQGSTLWRKEGEEAVCVLVRELEGAKPASVLEDEHKLEFAQIRKDVRRRDQPVPLLESAERQHRGVLPADDEMQECAQ
jgi:hypothetical protein